MIEDIRARGIELLVVDNVSNLVSRENCCCPIEKLRKMGIKVISLPTARISAKDHIIFKEPKQKKKSSMTHQKMREEWYKDLREHHRCTFEALANKK
jgi:predicted Fe-Mo cluster-binding NifX family protein